MPAMMANNLMPCVVSEIKAAFVNESGFRIVPTLDRAQVLEWMQSEDIDVQATLFHRLGYKGEKANIEPLLEFRQHHAFCLDYFRRCFSDYDNEADDELRGWEATHVFVYWFDSLLRDKSIPRSILDDTKTWLAQILIECPKIGGLMKSAIFDHLLYRKGTRKFFADWEANPQLSAFLR